MPGEIGPAEKLQLLTASPRFAWLRELSELMVDLDALGDDLGPRPDPVTLADVRSAVEILLTPAKDTEPSDGFAQQYARHLIEDPRVTMAHGDVKRVLSVWPAPASDGASRERVKTKPAAKPRRPPAGRS